MKHAYPRYIANFLWLVIAIAIIAVASYLAFTNLGHYSDNYDEGVYLESARMMDRGFPLYRSIFDSQPPLWLYLVDAGFKLGGESVRSGRLAGAAGFALSVVAVIVAGRELRGRLAGLLAGGLVTLSPFYLRFARLVEAEVPSAALAALAFAFATRYATVGRRRWLVLASLAVTASTLIKLLGVYTFPALAVLILMRWLPASKDWSFRIRQTVIDVAILVGIFVGVSGAFVLALGAPQVWNQASPSTSLRGARTIRPGCFSTSPT